MTASASATIASLSLNALDAQDLRHPVRHTDLGIQQMDLRELELGGEILSRNGRRFVLQ